MKQFYITTVVMASFILFINIVAGCVEHTNQLKYACITDGKAIEQCRMAF